VRLTLARALRARRAFGRAAFVPFLVAAKLLAAAGADVLEVGVPFSDPLADGPVIQRATERALAAGGNLRSALAMIGQVRPQIAAPIVVFSYANPLLRMGVDAFARQASCAHSMPLAPTCSRSACRSRIRWRMARSFSGRPSARWRPGRRWRGCWI